MDWMDWIGSPGGRGYRAPYGANNKYSFADRSFLSAVMVALCPEKLTLVKPEQLLLFLLLSFNK